ncbi:hypothetical protein DFH06DRAFT_1137331 [Mycena polygramma]|nr:hypothetical protein DFH06DRAFT_1137331 [Mycena polygramma]
MATPGPTTTTPAPKPSAGPAAKPKTTPATTTPAPKPTPAPAAKAKATPAVKKKPGNKGDFHGKRADFLTGKMDEYLTASKRGKTRDFYPRLFKDYWMQFNWCLPLDKDPSAADNFPANSAQLSEEEMKQKGRTQADVQRKIKTWYNHRRTAMGLTSNPFTPWLSRLRRPEGKAPKRITDYQYYMQHDKYKDSVNALFMERHWDAPRDEHLARRCDVARELFKLEPQTVKDEIRKEAQAELEAERTRWEDAEEGLPSLEEAEQEEARARFTGVVTPLLQALRAYTGYHVSMIAGRVVDGQFELKSVHAGTTKAATGEEGVDWTDWDKKGYKDHVLDQWMRYLVAADRAPGDSAVDPVASVGDANSSPNAVTPAAGANASPNGAGAPLGQSSGPTSSTPSQPDLPSLDNDDDPPASLIPPSSTPSSSLPPPPPASTEPSGVEEPGYAEMLEGRMSTLPILEDGMRAALMALDPEARERRLGELEAMSETQLRRANNIAHREAELAKAKARAEPIPPQTANPQKRKKAAPGKAAPRKRKQKGRRDEEDEDEPSAEESDSDDDDDDVEPARRDPPQTRQRKAAVTASGGQDAEQRGEQNATATAKTPGGTTTTAVTASGGQETEQRGEQNATATAKTPGGTTTDKAAATPAPGAKKAQAKIGAAVSTTRGKPSKSFEVAKAPKWAQNARATLLDSDFSTEQGWIDAIVAWWAFEASTKFVSPVRGFAADGRPSEIQTWIKYARATRPEIKNSTQFVEKWQGWWKSINPSWRLQDGVLVKESEGSWDVMRKPGSNGFLGVLACLKWWREEKGSTSEWADALADVTWVLRTLLTSSDESEDDDEDRMEGVVEYGSAGVPNEGAAGGGSGGIPTPGSGPGGAGNGGDEMEGVVTEM